MAHLILFPLEQARKLTEQESTQLQNFILELVQEDKSEVLGWLTDYRNQYKEQPINGNKSIKMRAPSLYKQKSAPLVANVASAPLEINMVPAPPPSSTGHKQNFSAVMTQIKERATNMNGKGHIRRRSTSITAEELDNSTAMKLFREKEASSSDSEHETESASDDNDSDTDN